MTMHTKPVPITQSDDRFEARIKMMRALRLMGQPGIPSHLHFMAPIGDVCEYYKFGKLLIEIAEVHAGRYRHKRAFKRKRKTYRVLIYTREGGIIPDLIREFDTDNEAAIYVHSEDLAARMVIEAMT